MSRLQVRIVKGIIFSLMVIGLLLIPQSIGAKSDYYAVGYEYQSPAHLLKLEGSISTSHVISDGCGSAGIEQDVAVATETGELMLEVINWYREGNVVIGITVYQNGEYYFSQKVDAEIGEIYDYKVYICSGNVYVFIYSGSELVFHKVLYDVGAKYIPRTASYLEYWQDQGCSFYYYGWVSVSNIKYLEYKEDSYYKAKGLPFGLYFVHHKWDVCLDKGEIDDR